MDELLRGLPPRKRHRRRIHGRHKLTVSTATIRSDINVTPLVDVVLVLLIIFMVVTPMITRGKPVEMPETKYHDQKNDSGEQIVVSVVCNEPHVGAGDRGPGISPVVCGSSSVYVGTERADTEAQVIEQVQKEMRAHAGREIHVKADRRLDYGAVREALERVHAAGVGAVALGSEEDKSVKKEK